MIIAFQHVSREKNWTESLIFKSFFLGRFLGISRKTFSVWSKKQTEVHKEVSRKIFKKLLCFWIAPFLGKFLCNWVQKNCFIEGKGSFLNGKQNFWCWFPCQKEKEEHQVPGTFPVQARVCGLFCISEKKTISKMMNSETCETNHRIKLQVCLSLQGIGNQFPVQREKTFACLLSGKISWKRHRPFSAVQDSSLIVMTVRNRIYWIYENQWIVWIFVSCFFSPFFKGKCFVLVYEPNWRSVDWLIRAFRTGIRFARSLSILVDWVHAQTW